MLSSNKNTLFCVEYPTLPNPPNMGGDNLEEQRKPGI